MNPHVKKSTLCLLLIGLSLLTLSGCLRSLHPLYTEETLVFEPKLLGKWSEADSDDFWLFEQVGDEKEYQVTIQESDEDAPAVLVGHLAKVGEDLYLDLFLEDAEVKGGTYVELHLLPVHTFLRIKQIQPTLQMAFVNPTTAGKIIKREPESVKHEFVEDDVPVLTAGPKEIQKFITTHTDTEDFFGDYSEMKPVAPETEKKAPEKSEAKEKPDSSPKKEKAPKP